ncbi:MAG: 4'-phosphopantetheinyl transferase superfamily protein [Paludibacteraceae bacterium]|nr:4'-phosphopantetheinyl transferase superfamily protein [Paludibacteraceae bacterium]
MTRCTAEEVRRLMSRVLPARQKEAMRYKHVFGQYCCLRSYEMLDELLHAAGYAMSPWRTNQYGKPYLTDGPFFSISHCRLGIAVAIADREIGVDIESIRRADRSLVERTMNDAEQAEIFRSDRPDEAFTALWTQKEAVLKMRGTGILDDLHHVLDAPQDYTLQTFRLPEKGYCYSVGCRV